MAGRGPAAALAARRERRRVRRSGTVDLFLVLMALVLLLALAAFAATGAVLLRTGLRSRARAARLSARGASATATVVDDEPLTYRDVTVAHSPVVSFRTDEGEDVVAVAPDPSSRGWRRGSVVRVEYDQDEPEVLRVAAPGRRAAGGTAQAVLGAVLLVVAALGLVGGVVLAVTVA